MDWQTDAKSDSRSVKFPNVIDEYGRFCLAVRVGKRCRAEDGMAVVEGLTSLYPAPANIRSDNGPQFMARALRDWCEASDITSTACPEQAHIQPVLLIRPTGAPRPQL